jgi:hypothetical protein
VDGAEAVMLVLLQDVARAATPLNVTVLVPCVFPKAAPEIVTDVPMGPSTGEMPDMIGGTLNGTPLLGVPATVTTTGPLVALDGTGATIVLSLQLVGVAGTPLKVTVLVP